MIPRTYADFEPEDEETEAEALAYAVVSEMLPDLEEAEERREALDELTRLSEEMGHYDEPLAWSNDAQWQHDAAVWLLSLQRTTDPLVLWFNEECDEEALRRERGEAPVAVVFEPEKPKTRAKKRQKK